MPTTKIENIIDERLMEIDEIEKLIDQGKTPEEILKKKPEIYDEYMLRWLDIFG